MKWMIHSAIALSLVASLSAAEKAPRTKQPQTPPLTVLQETSETFSEIAEAAMPATVSVKAQIQAHQPQQDISSPFDMFGDELFRRFFGNQSPFHQQHPLQPQQPQPQPQMAGGSGFLISSDGYIVTNNHVIQDAIQVTATLNDGREYTATVVGSDPRTDLAVLKIEEKDLPCLKFGDSDKVKIGNWVIAIGNPFGLEATLTVGVVSAKGRQDLGIASYEDFIQTDAAINPGNSGGPLLNLQGEVVGVNTAIYTRSGGYMGIGLSIPSKMVQNVIEQIRDGGSVKRAFLGIVLQPLDKELSSAIGIEKQEGVLVSEVLADSPAAKAGLMQGDVIVKYNGKIAKQVAKFRNEIALMSPGSSIALQVLRNNKPLEIKVALGAQDEGETVSVELLQKLGIEIDNLTTELASKFGLPTDVSGIVITKVKPGSPAANAGLRPSFLITGIAVDWSNQKPVKTTTDFQNGLKDLGNKRHIILIVRHQNFQRYYTIKLG